MDKNTKIKNRKKSKFSKSSLKKNKKTKKIKSSLQTKDTKKLVQNLITLFKENEFNNNLLKEVKYFSKDKIGKSGANIGFINYKNKPCIIKIFKKKKATMKINYYKDCIKINFDLNELIINYILNNIELFISSKHLVEYKKKKFQENIVKNELYKITDKNILIINEKIGIKLKDNYITNLKELLIFDYIPYINKLIKTSNLKDLNEFQTTFSKILNNWFDVQLFLSERFNIVNTDSKCANIFIRKTSKSSKLNYINNVKLLFSDLDKSRYKINNTTILCSDNIKANILTYTKFKNIYNFRYVCKNKADFCDHFKEYHFDRLILIFDIYIYLCKNVYFMNKKLFKNIDDFFDKFKILNNTFKNALDLNEQQFKIFKELLAKSSIISKKRSQKVSYHINLLIYSYCKKLTRKKKY